jgi:hypothetical protein
MLMETSAVILAAHLFIHICETNDTVLLCLDDYSFDLQEPDFINLFSPCEGFIDARIRRDKNDKCVVSLPEFKTDIKQFFAIFAYFCVNNIFSDFLEAK